MESDISVFFVLGGVPVIIGFRNPGWYYILEPENLTWLVVIKLSLVKNHNFPANYASILLTGNDCAIHPVNYHIKFVSARLKHSLVNFVLIYIIICFDWANLSMDFWTLSLNRLVKFLSLLHLANHSGNRALYFVIFNLIYLVILPGLIVIQIKSYCQTIAMYIVSIHFVHTPKQINWVDALSHLIFEGTHYFINIFTPDLKNFLDGADKRFYVSIKNSTWMLPNFWQN